MTFCCEGKNQWESMLVEAFPNYDIAVSEAMRGLHSAVLVLRQFKRSLKVEKMNKIKTGAGGWMGTKGAIGI